MDLVDLDANMEIDALDAGFDIDDLQNYLSDNTSQLQDLLQEDYTRLPEYLLDTTNTDLQSDPLTRLIFSGVLPESPPDSGSEHITSPLHSSPSPLHTSSSPSTLSTPSSLSPSTFSTPSPFSSQEVSGGVVSHYPFSSNTQQHQPSSLQHTQISRDLREIDYTKPLLLLQQGAEGLHQDLNLPYLGGKRTSLPARLNPIPLINQSIPVQSTNSSLIGRSNPPNSFMKPVLNKNQQTSDLRNAYIGPPRGPNIPVTLENRFPQKQGLEDEVKEEPIRSPVPGVPLTVVAPPRKRRKEEGEGSATVHAPLDSTRGQFKTEGEAGDSGLVKFFPFRPETWGTTFNNEYKAEGVPGLTVRADKGFNYSATDEAFIAQKKNHFQLTCHVTKDGMHSMLKTGTGYSQIQFLQLNFAGVKKEAPDHIIQIEQSQADRSRKKFFPIRLSFKGDQPMRVSVGRLHFSETTLNNMRKRGKPNPDQRYFQLVVSIEAVLQNRQTVCLVALATDKIIVRASNPGLFETDTSEGGWIKGADTLYHLGKVGIGTDVSEESLTVQGNLQVAGEILHPSDRRIKEDITLMDPKVQLQNVQNIQVVKYKYKPEYLQNFPEDERQKMGQYQTGILAQELAQVLPDAVHTAGDLELSSGETIPDMLIVNKDRLFLENIGAVRELSKMTDNLGSRIEELESHSVKMNNLKRFGSVRSSTSLTSSCSGVLGSRHRSLFKSRTVQTILILLVAVMTISLVAMASVYIAWYVQHGRDTPSIDNKFNNTDIINRRVTSPVPGPGLMTTRSPDLVTTRFPLITTKLPSRRLSTKSGFSGTRTPLQRYRLDVLLDPPPIGVPQGCSEFNACESFCDDSWYTENRSAGSSANLTRDMYKTVIPEEPDKPVVSMPAEKIVNDSGLNLEQDLKRRHRENLPDSRAVGLSAIINHLSNFSSEIVQALKPISRQGLDDLENIGSEISEALKKDLGQDGQGSYNDFSLNVQDILRQNISYDPRKAVDINTDSRNQGFEDTTIDENDKTDAPLPSDDGEQDQKIIASDDAVDNDKQQSEPQQAINKQTTTIEEEEWIEQKNTKNFHENSAILTLEQDDIFPLDGTDSNTIYRPEGSRANDVRSIEEAKLQEGEFSSKKEDIITKEKDPEASAVPSYESVENKKEKDHDEIPPTSDRLKNYQEVYPYKEEKLYSDGSLNQDEIPDSYDADKRDLGATEILEDLSEAIIPPEKVDELVKTVDYEILKTKSEEKIENQEEMLSPQVDNTYDELYKDKFANENQDEISKSAEESSNKLKDQNSFYKIPYSQEDGNENQDLTQDQEDTKANDDINVTKSSNLTSNDEQEDSFNKSSKNDEVKGSIETPVEAYIDSEKKFNNVFPNPISEISYTEKYNIDDTYQTHEDTGINPDDVKVSEQLSEITYNERKTDFKNIVENNSEQIEIILLPENDAHEVVYKDVNEPTNWGNQDVIITENDTKKDSNNIFGEKDEKPGSDVDSLNISENAFNSSIYENKTIEITDDEIDTHARTAEEVLNFDDQLDAIQSQILKEEYKEQDENSAQDQTIFSDEETKIIDKFQSYPEESNSPLGPSEPLIELDNTNMEKYLNLVNKETENQNDTANVMKDKILEDSLLSNQTFNTAHGEHLAQVDNIQILNEIQVSDLPKTVSSNSDSTPFKELINKSEVDEISNTDNLKEIIDDNIELNSIPKEKVKDIEIALKHDGIGDIMEDQGKILNNDQTNIDDGASRVDKTEDEIYDEIWNDFENESNEIPKHIEDENLTKGKVEMLQDQAKDNDTNLDIEGNDTRIESSDLFDDEGDESESVDELYDELWTEDKEEKINKNHKDDEFDLACENQKDGPVCKDDQSKLEKIDLGENIIFKGNGKHVEHTEEDPIEGAHDEDHEDGYDQLSIDYKDELQEDEAEKSESPENSKEMLSFKDDQKLRKVSDLEKTGDQISEKGRLLAALNGIGLSNEEQAEKFPGKFGTTDNVQVNLPKEEDLNGTAKEISNDDEGYWDEVSTDDYNFNDTLVKEDGQGETNSSNVNVDIENDDDDTTGKIVKRSAGGVNLNYESGVWTDFNSLLTWYRRNNLEQVSKKVPNHLQNSVDHQTHSNLEFVEGKKSSVKESFSRENEVSAKSASLGRKKRGVMNGLGCVPWNGERVRIKVDTSVGRFNLSSENCKLCDGTNLTCLIPISRHLADESVEVRIAYSGRTLVQCTTSPEHLCTDEDIDEDLDDNEDEDMERICVNYNLRRLRKLNLSFIGSNQQNLDNPSLLCSAESNKLAETSRQTDHKAAENFHHFNIHLLIYRHCSRNTNL